MGCISRSTSGKYNGRRASNSTDRLWASKATHYTPTITTVFPHHRARQRRQGARWKFSKNIHQIHNKISKMRVQFSCVLLTLVLTFENVCHTFYVCVFFHIAICTYISYHMCQAVDLFVSMGCRTERMDRNVLFSLGRISQDTSLEDS